MSEAAGDLTPNHGNPWLETFTGRRFWPAEPRVQDITVFDIAHSLAYKCRYNGHTCRYYSVAEHSVVLAMFARHLQHPVELQYHMLMHDGSETYLPDVPRPIKHFFPELVAMEKHLDGVIREWAGLGQTVPQMVKEWDSRIIVDERQQVLLPSGNSWQSDSLQPLGVQLSSLPPHEAEAAFLNAYRIIASEFHGRKVFCAYDKDEFATGSTFGFDSPVTSDRPKFQPLDIRMIDLRGACAMYVNDDGYYRFQHGNFEIVNPARA